MTRTWKSLTLAALLLALVAAPAARATDPEKERKPLTDSEKLDAIMRQIGDLRNELKGDIQDARTLAQLKSQVLEERLKALTEKVERLEKSSALTRSSYFQPTPAAPVPPGAGTLVLQNTWGDTATVMLNDRAVVVPPYQTVTLDNQAAGTYTYEVLVNGFGRIRGPVSRVLNNNDRMIISVYPVPAIR